MTEISIRDAITFDDVLLEPAASSIIPSQAKTTTWLTPNIGLSIPLVSAAMDTVTEASMAIAMSQAGGIGILHRNFSIEAQANEIRKVKRFESGMVIDPLTITPEMTIQDVLDIKIAKKISGFPVVERGGSSGSGKLVGILTNRDMRFCADLSEKVSSLMTKDGLVTVSSGVTMEDAKRLLHQHRIERLIVVDDDYNCVGLITVNDIEKSEQHPHAVKDYIGRLRVGAATSVGDEGYKRATALIDAGADVVIIDTAHGHSRSVIDQVARLKKEFSNTDIIAGNIATADAASALIDAGADALKVGIGPGSICTTRVVAGVGVPQLTAIMDVKQAIGTQSVKLIADGGVKFSGDLAKALAAGADSIMIGSLLAGTDESPGEVFLYQGRSYKAYRGMGSVGAMAKGSADRYFQKDVSDSLKLVPEGIEGQVPHKGSVRQILHQLVGGLKASMGYLGAETIDSIKPKARFVRLSNAGLKESHVHDVAVTREAPNYPTGR